MDIDHLVRPHIYACLSSLISHLADDTPDDEQIQNLQTPVLDYEEAAIQAGWQEGEEGRIVSLHGDDSTYDSWEDCCEDQRIDPYECEIYEHWAVSQWLAKELEKHGERVDMDFHGLCVWARTTTGQSISQDYVIKQIFDEGSAP